MTGTDSVNAIVWISIAVLIWGTPLAAVVWVHRKELSIKVIIEGIFHLLVWAGGVFVIVATYRFSMHIASYLVPSPWHHGVLVSLLLPFGCLVRFIIAAHREAVKSEVREYQIKLLKHADARLFDSWHYSIWSMPDFDRVPLETYDSILERLVELGASQERPSLPGFLSPEEVKGACTKNKQ
jgi:hypothetical protein